MSGQGDWQRGGLPSLPRPRTCRCCWWRRGPVLVLSWRRRARCLKPGAAVALRSCSSPPPAAAPAALAGVVVEAGGGGTGGGLLGESAAAAAAAAIGSGGPSPPPSPPARPPLVLAGGRGLAWPGECGPPSTSCCVLHPCMHAPEPSLRPPPTMACLPVSQCLTHRGLCSTLATSSCLWPPTWRHASTEPVRL